jgi:anti-sigma regulatory factor (Ser/Thr protein kinase)
MMPVCYRAERSFAASSRAPKAARDFCADQLRATLSDIAPARDVIADASVVVSELVTNSVGADARRIEAAIVVHRTHLLLSVYDDADGEPHSLHPDVADERGRGLQIVDAYSLKWGFDEQTTGKQVWAMLAVPDEATTDMNCNIYALV